jgi:hypothetical protein
MMDPANCGGQITRAERTTDDAIDISGNTITIEAKNSQLIDLVKYH